MRIISKFYDYYDKAVAYGIDPALVYVRERKEFDIRYGNKYYQNKLSSLWQSMPRFTAGQYGVIGFCGKAYPFYRFISGNITKVYYSVASIKKDLSNKTLESMHTTLNGGNYELDYFFNRNLEDLQNFVNNKYYYLGSNQRPESFDVNYGKSISDDLFREFDSPILLVTNITYNTQNLVVNPILKEYNFVSQFDPVTTFQEISMYLGSNLVKQKDPNPKFSDEIKRDILGFDEWSFRKQKK